MDREGKIGEDVNVKDEGVDLSDVREVRGGWSGAQVLLWGGGGEEKTASHVQVEKKLVELCAPVASGSHDCKRKLE